MPTLIHSQVASRTLDSAIARHQQLLKADQSPEDLDPRDGFIRVGEGANSWTATVSKSEKGGSYSLTTESAEDPQDTVTFNDGSLVRQLTYGNYDGRTYMTTTHVDRNDLNNSWESTRVVDPRSIWQD